MGKLKVAQKKDEAKETSAKSGPVSGGKDMATPKVSASSRRVLEGRIYIQATYNNTMITATDSSGRVIAWMTAGSLGFSGPKKATPFAASKVAEAIAQKIEKTGPSLVEIYVRGVGSGRDSAIRSLAAKGLQITSIKDVTPIPHNGPKPAKVRRV